ncbi:hypothetical protein CANARDRAFT_137901 [[Candida] arabinofermentans NRRL YB-2248]|uniref:Uncharacterized protein n=1 Tax=[Candida] arabinofermentans NRRL YB-2248 TaxID=983967 RepID=A0A1E4T1L6_9ASCO|nr:hypothetical protein CANARDRAFT_137901 [[Candida] arabinofermentans NRRL YB-2248]
MSYSIVLKIIVFVIPPLNKQSPQTLRFSSFTETTKKFKTGTTSATKSFLHCSPIVSFSMKSNLHWTPRRSFQFSSGRFHELLFD